MTNGQPRMADFATPQEWLTTSKAWDAAAIAQAAPPAFPELTPDQKAAKQAAQDIVNAKSAATKAAGTGKPKMQGPAPLCASRHQLKEDIANGTVCPETLVTFGQIGKLAKRAAQNAAKIAKNTAANAAQGEAA